MKKLLVLLAIALAVNAQSASAGKQGFFTVHTALPGYSVKTLHTTHWAAADTSNHQVWVAVRINGHRPQLGYNESLHVVDVVDHGVWITVRLKPQPAPVLVRMANTGAETARITLKFSCCQLGSPSS